MGIRCVSDRPWITAAETCECLLVLPQPRRARPRAASCSPGPSASATDDGHYWTGIVFPEMVHFPGNERHDLHLGLDRAGRRRAERRLGPASQLFVDHDLLPALIDADAADAADVTADPSLD